MNNSLTLASARCVAETHTFPANKSSIFFKAKGVGSEMGEEGAGETTRNPLKSTNTDELFKTNEAQSLS